MPQRSKSPNTYERKMHRSMKRDALRQNRLNGCRCLNVRAHVTQPDQSSPDITVITAPHSPDCPLQLAAIEQPDERYAAPGMGEPPKLWTPNA